MRKIALIPLLLCISLALYCQIAPKREFRGAWIQAVNHQFEGIPTELLKAELSSQVDKLAECGINAILFQVRVEGDALYRSDLEPWSAYLTGEQGREPDQPWDPLQFMIDICHSHGMELHAWINPYRAKTASTTVIAPDHQMSLHPERFVQYGDLVLFNPALAENRDYICSVAADIVTRYDIDGFHIDDYFYPYPESGLTFNDDADFRRDSRGFTNKDDWRRDNVTLFIKQLYATLKQIKPWVKFGISPFGIYRNRTDDYPDGSATNGLENYSGLYADVLYWMQQGWMDYCIPQLYWNVGYGIADYEVLVNWWADHSYGCPVYIGQDVERTLKEANPYNRTEHQQRLKLNLQRSRQELGGSCQWPAKSVVDSPAYREVLKTEYYQYPALQPLSKNLERVAPGKVRKIRVISTTDGNVLFWSSPVSAGELDKAYRYVVYRFASKETINIDDPSHIVCVTDRTYYLLGNSRTGKNCVYVVTALSRAQAESAPVKCKVKSKSQE